MRLGPKGRINALRTHLETLVSPDIVTRNYEDVVKYDDPNRNIFAIVSGGFPSFGGWTEEDDEQHTFMILAQRWVGDTVTGEEKEDIEFDLLATLRQMVVEDGQNDEPLNLEILKAHQSRQMDPNHAWVLVEMQFNDL